MKQAEASLMEDPRRVNLVRALARLKGSLSSRQLYLPESAEMVLSGDLSVENLTRLVFLSGPILAPGEADEVKGISAAMLGRAFRLDPRVADLLRYEDKWDCHVSWTQDYYMPEMHSSGLFGPLEEGGNALFLVAGISEEALALKRAIGGQDFGISVLEKDPRYALACMMRGFRLLFGRPTGIEEDWGRRVAAGFDFAFLTFPDQTIDFRHAALNMDLALRPGGHAVAIGSLDFAEALTDYFSARYEKIGNPMRWGSVIEDEHLQVYRKPG